MSSETPKKTAVKGLRLEAELLAQFEAACAASNMKTEDALRMATQAMVLAYKEFGVIPKDMEIKQRLIGNMGELKDLVAAAVAEGQARYFTGKQEPIVPAKSPAENEPLKQKRRRTA